VVRRNLDQEAAGRTRRSGSEREKTLDVTKSGKRPLIRREARANPRPQSGRQASGGTREETMRSLALFSIIQERAVGEAEASSGSEGAGGSGGDARRERERGASRRTRTLKRRVRLR
jgi:hypothetical protein